MARTTSMNNNAAVSSTRASHHRTLLHEVKGRPLRSYTDRPGTASDGIRGELSFVGALWVQRCAKSKLVEFRSIQMIHPARWTILKSKDPRHTGEGRCPGQKWIPAF